LRCLRLDHQSHHFGDTKKARVLGRPLISIVNKDSSEKGLDTERPFEQSDSVETEVISLLKFLSLSKCQRSTASKTMMKAINIMSTIRLNSATKSLNKMNI